MLVPLKYMDLACSLTKLLIGVLVLRRMPTSSSIRFATEVIRKQVYARRLDMMLGFA